MRVIVWTGSRWVTCVAKDTTASNRTTRTERPCLLEKAHLLADFMKGPVTTGTAH